MTFRDASDREITYLRISLTDRCNFRCVYCMPDENMEWIPRDEILTFEELELIVSVFAKHNLKRIRLTGGEPLLRKGICDLIRRFRNLGIDEIALTTNAFLLPKFADALKKAGLTHINVSFDSLEPDTFKKISRNQKLDRVLDGLQSAQDAGFENIKLNSVIIRGINDHEILNLVTFAAERKHILRFIEFMPIGLGTVWGDTSVPLGEIRQKLSEQGNLVPEKKKMGMGPARYWTFSSNSISPTPIGFISALSSCFCDDCNRIRITPTGGLRACLADDREEDLATLIRAEKTDADKKRVVEETVHRALAAKKPSHDFTFDEEVNTLKRMHAIGG